MTKFISQASKIYASALTQLNIDKSTIINSLSEVIKVFEKSEDLRVVFSNSSINFGKKKEILSEIFNGKIDKQLVNFLCILTEKNKINLLGEIVASFEQLSAEASGICVVEVISAIELNEHYKNKIMEKLESKLNKKIKPVWNVSNKIIGGLIFKINDTVIDTSLKNEIDKFSKIMI